MDHEPTRINWPTGLFLALSFLVAVVGTPWYAWRFGLGWFDLGHFLVMAHLTGMSITMGYHRLYTHRAYDASWPVRLLVLLFGAAAFQNSVLRWASEHRYHHKYTDHDGHPRDPYSISRGFFHAHVGWLLARETPALERDNVSDLARDPLLAWQDRHIHLLAAVMGFGLPTLVGMAHAGSTGGSLAVGALGGFLIGGCLRLVVVQHSTFFVNSLAHTLGRRPYDSTQSARDNALVSVLTFGEGYHNFHHTFQTDYRNGVKPWQWDPSKWTIWVLARLRLATRLRRTPIETVRLAELRERRRQLEHALAEKGLELRAQLAQAMDGIEERLEAAHLRVRVLLTASKRRGLEASRQATRELRRELGTARRAFRELVAEWESARGQLLEMVRVESR